MVPIAPKHGTWDQDNWPPWRVFAHKPMTLPPRSHVVFSVQCENPTEKEVVFTPSPLLSERQELLVASSIHQCDQEGKIPIMVLNPTNVVQYIHQGTTMGHVQPPPTQVEAPICTMGFQAGDKPDPLDQLDLSHATLSEAEKRRMKDFLQQYQDVFAVSSADLGCYPGVQHEIKTGDHPPICQRPYRVPSAYKAEVEKQMEEMMDSQVVEPSSSPWSSPLVIVPKKDGALRLCCDFRKLNSITEKDVYPLPLIDEVLDQLAEAQYFTTLDLQSGYWQLEVSPADRPKTAVITPRGLYQFIRMPFGLCNAPATFQRAMNQVLLGLQPHVALVYLDDIIIHSPNLEQHLTI
jgi:hypothetical protein